MPAHPGAALCAVALVMALGASACAGAAAPAPPRTARAGPTDRAGYASLVARLEDAQASCQNACCDRIRQLPGWLAQWWANRTGTDDRARSAAIDALEHARDPRVRALAALRLGAFARTDDVARLARLVHDKHPGAPLPTPPPMTQIPVPCRSPATQPHTLGQTALLALRKVTGQRFYSVAQFEAWRRAHPDPERSVAYWEDQMESGDPAVLGPRLRASDPDLYCRAALAPRNESSGFQAWLGEKERLRCAHRLGAERLLALIAGSDTSWPELSEWQRRAAFCRFVLEHAEQLLRPDQADGLLALRDRATAGQVDAPAALLAIAASRLAPSRRHSILVSADAQGATAAELARYFPGKESERVLSDFYANAEQRPDILDGITRAGPPARALLHAIVADPRFPADNYYLVSALLPAAGAVLPAAAIHCPGLWPGGKELGRLSPAERDARIARSRAAARRCSVRVDKALRQ